jgi:hypothetical protein
MTEEQYMLAVRSSLQHDMVACKRAPADVWTNQYSPKLLHLHQANHDVQLVLNPYAAVMYITNYMAKMDRSMSETMRVALHQAQTTGQSPMQQVRAHLVTVCNHHDIRSMYASMQPWPCNSCM